jgi:hypothetical protein
VNMFQIMRNSLPHFSKRKLTKKFLTFFLGAVATFGMSLAAQDSSSAPAQPAFPDTDALIERVAKHQKDVEALLDQYTCTYKTTFYTLDKAGSVRNQHTDVYYMTPTPYEVFLLHISHDEKPTSSENLQKQEKEIEHKLQSYERKAEKNPGSARPKDALLFGDIILKSKFAPLRWEDVAGAPAIVYSFEPKVKPVQRGSANDKIAGDMKGKMWINPEAAEVVRMEFSSAAPVGLNFMLNVKSFQGFVEQRKVKDEVWLPSRQEFVAQGREIVKGFRIRQVSEFSDYLKATTDVFQQVHGPIAASGDEPTAQSGSNGQK